MQKDVFQCAIRFRQQRAVSLRRGRPSRLTPNCPDPEYPEADPEQGPDERTNGVTHRLICLRSVTVVDVHAVEVG
jgi:hypothetical protein